MSTVPLGIGAYERLYAGEPVVRLENRFVETNPTNLKEKIALLARPGTDPLKYFNSGKYRRCFSKEGLFGSDLFVIAGETMWRYAEDGTTHEITGVFQGSGPPSITWYKGIGIERLFVADGLLLQYYDGGTHATGTLTATGAITTQKVQIGEVWYTWGADVNANAPNGTEDHPWIAKLDSSPMVALAKLLMFAGVQGVDYSSTLGGPSLTVTAVPNSLDPDNILDVTAISGEADGNTIATTVDGSDLAWGETTLTGGGVHTMHGIPMPDGKPAKSLATISSYVLISVAKSQQFFFLRPGSVEIDALDFYTKESNPDEIIDMTNVGDQAILCGSGSTETWYATGVLDSPLAAVKGRAYQRGVLEGTVCVVKESVILVGNDGIVYEIGSGSGITRVSNHGIEERIRVQRVRERTEGGL